MSYCNLPVEDHAVVVIKGQVSTEQSKQQHSHTPHVSLEVTHTHTHSSISASSVRVGISQLSCTESCTSEYDQYTMKKAASWNRQVIMTFSEKQMQWFVGLSEYKSLNYNLGGSSCEQLIAYLLPLNQYMLFPGWVQEQRTQGCHSTSWAHNSNLPEREITT